MLGIQHSAATKVLYDDDNKVTKLYKGIIHELKQRQQQQCDDGDGDMLLPTDLFEEFSCIRYIDVKVQQPTTPPMRGRVNW